MNYALIPQFDLADTLDAFLTPDTRAVLYAAAKLAEQHGWRLYLVGGTVRDMLLGRAAADLDLTVEGDAIGLAEALAAEIDGHVTRHVQFGTAVVQAGDVDAALTLDLVTARAERYPIPAVLPEVQPAGLREDLERRDFSLNALALGLGSADYGLLYDVTGGWNDLELRQLRVLHDQSFRDDPTRILRGIRLAARLGCVIEAQTLELIRVALQQGYMQRLSPARVFHELLLVVEEADPAPVVELLAQLDVLAAIHPALRWRQEMPSWFDRARAHASTPDMWRALGCALLAYAMDSASRANFAASFPFDAAMTRVLRDITRIEQLVPQLSAADLARSVIDQLLDGVETVALWAFQIAAPTACSTNISLYLHVLRHMQPALDGDDLRALGLRPGPQFRVLLAGLRAAYLDGVVATREEQLRWVRWAAKITLAAEAE